MQYTTVTNPVWANAEHTAIDCLVAFVGIGMVPFTASLDDGYSHTSAIFTAAAQGSYGPVAEYEPSAAPSSVPQVVSRFQARAALHLAGLLTAVQSAMDDPATPMLSRLAWQDAQEFRRNSPTVLAMATALSLDEAALDGLFTVAAGIEA